VGKGFGFLISVVGVLLPHISMRNTQQWSLTFSEDKQWQKNA